MKCPNCGKKNATKAAMHCEFCGKKLKNSVRKKSKMRVVLVAFLTMLGIAFCGHAIYLSVSANIRAHDFFENYENGNKRSDKGY